MRNFLPKSRIEKAVNGLREDAKPGDVKVIAKDGKVSYQPGSFFSPEFTRRYNYKQGRR